MLKPIVKQVFTPAVEAVPAGKERVVRTGPHAVAVDMTMIRSAYTPDTFEVREGDAVTFRITNVETVRDMIHGFALPDHNLNIALPPGDTKTITVDAGKPGVYWFYCTNFCSALHLEMRGPDGRAAQRQHRRDRRLARRPERQGHSGARGAINGGVRTCAIAIAGSCGGGARAVPPRGSRTGDSACRRLSIRVKSLMLAACRTPASRETCRKWRRCSKYIGVRFPEQIPELRWLLPAMVGLAVILGLAGFAGAGLHRSSCCGGRGVALFVGFWRFLRRSCNAACTKWGTTATSTRRSRRSKISHRDWLVRPRWAISPSGRFLIVGGLALALGAALTLVGATRAGCAHEASGAP